MRFLKIDYIIIIIKSSVDFFFNQKLQLGHGGHVIITFSVFLLTLQ